MIVCLYSEGERSLLIATADEKFTNKGIAYGLDAEERRFQILKLQQDR